MSTTPTQNPNLYHVLQCGYHTGGDIEEAIRLASEEVERTGATMRDLTAAERKQLRKMFKSEFASGAASVFSVC